MIEFIRFNDFIIKKSEIVSVEREGMSILIRTKNDSLNNDFSVNYDSEYCLNDGLDSLASDLDSCEMDYGQLVSCIKKQNSRIMTNYRLVFNEIEEVKKEIRVIKKYIKSAGDKQK